MTDYDQLVRELIWRKFRDDEFGTGSDEWARASHLQDCPEAAINEDEAEAYNGSYGCDTGCEYARFEARIRCPHVAPYDYEWGDFGMIDDYIREIDETRPA